MTPDDTNVAAHPVRAGIDLGGTGTRVALLGPDLEVRGYTGVLTSTLAGGEPAERVAALAALVRAILPPSAEITSVGVGASGPVGSDGVIRNIDTLPAFSGFPLREMLETELGAPCQMDNDAVAAALGEYHVGTGDRARSMIMVTLGTGIGVAVLSAGVPLRALDGTHPEGGHIPVSGGHKACYCGARSCWEPVASRSALERAADGVATIEALADEARRGGRRAVEIFRDYGLRVGTGLSALVTLYRPDLVVLGGTAAKYYELFAAGVAAAASRNGPFAVPMIIRVAGLGDSAGAIGAALIPAPPPAPEPPLALASTSRSEL